ncbi:CvpA family protein [Paludifilum halophilum]|nr:CvpA family protein [Paludifilum halophilum]
MSIMDGIIVFLIVGGLIQGYRKGLIKEAASLISVLLALFVAYRYSGDIAPILRENVPWPDSWGSEGMIGLLPVEQALSTVLAFVLLFIVTKILVSTVASVLTGIASLPILAQINRIGGAAFGLVKVLLVVMIAVNLLQLLPWSDGRDIVKESSLSQGILQMTPDLTGTDETVDQP